MSDKETAPWMREAAKEILCESGDIYEDDVDDVSQIIAKHAVECTAPAPQQWKSHFTDSDVTGDIHNYVDTGDGKRLWAQDADEIVKRHNEQALQELELEQESDGRWLAEYTRFPGVMAYGKSPEEAIRNAAKVLIEAGEVERG